MKGFEIIITQNKNKGQETLQILTNDRFAKLVESVDIKDFIKLIKEMLK